MWDGMSDVIFLMIAIVFVLGAFLLVAATMNASPRVSPDRRIANRVIYGSCVAALISVVLGAWLLFRPPRQSCRRTKSIHGLRIGRCLHQSGYRGGTEPRPLLSRLAFDPAS